MPETPRRSPTAVARAAVLLVVAVAVEALIWRLRPTGTATTPVDAIVLACAWLAWLVAGWLALCIAVCAAKHLRGRRGLDQRRVAIGHCVPRRLGRLVDAVVTAGLVGAIVGGAVIPAAADAATTAVTAASHRAVSGDPLDWPGLGERPSPPPAHDPAPAHPRSRPARIALVSAAPRGAADREPVVTVRTGDSLWSIAAAHLGPGATAGQIAAQWPRWYAANRSVIGADPTLILPGQQLRPPAEQAADRTHHRAGSTR